MMIIEYHSRHTKDMLKTLGFIVDDNNYMYHPPTVKIKINNDEVVINHQTNEECLEFKDKFIKFMLYANTGDYFTLNDKEKDIKVPTISLNKEWNKKRFLSKILK